MKIQLSTLRDLLAPLSPVVQKKTANRNCEFIVFRGKYAYTSNDFMVASLLNPISELGDFIVNADEFFSILGLMADGEVTLKLTEKVFSIHHSKSHAKLSLAQEVNIQHILNAHPIAENAKGQSGAIPEGFIEKLEAVRSFRNTSAVQGVCLSGPFIYATNGNRVVRASVPAPLPPAWLFPVQAQVLAKQPLTSLVAVADGKRNMLVGVNTDIGYWVVMNTGDVTAYPVSKLDAVIASKATAAEGDVLVPTGQEFIDAVNKATVFAALDDGHLLMNIEVTPNGLDISSSKTAGNFTEFIEFPAALQLPEGVESIGFVIDETLAQQLTAYGSDFRIKLGGAVPILVVHGNGIIYMSSTFAAPTVPETPASAEKEKAE